MGAIAAGCPAVLKPSEVASNVAAVLAEYIPKYLDNRAYKVVNGSVKETTKLLELKCTCHLCGISVLSLIGFSPRGSQYVV